MDAVALLPILKNALPLTGRVELHSVSESGTLTILLQNEALGVAVYVRVRPPPGLLELARAPEVGDALEVEAFERPQGAPDREEAP